MFRSRFSTVAAVAALAVLAVLAPMGSGAQEGTPTAPAPEATLAPGATLCTPEEIALGDAEITQDPDGNWAIAEPSWSGGTQLYMTFYTLPPGACLLHEQVVGATVIMVREGTVDFAARGWEFGEPPTGEFGNDHGDFRDMPLSTPLPLEAGDWVTLDGEAEYEIRNGGSAEATVVMAVHEVILVPANGCTSGCRNRGR